MNRPPSDLYLNSEFDNLFESGPWPKPFVFNEDVVRVFDDMVSRSVPLYQEVLLCAARWTRAYYQSGTKVIDVGCSTGTFMELVGRTLTETAQLVGIDNSKAMLDKAAEKLNPLSEIHTVQLHCLSATDAAYDNSSVIVLNYTLQFLPLSERLNLLKLIYDGLVPGGLLFISEKVRSDNPQFQETITHQYEAFKERNGYAKTEIERKKEALEHVLIPLTYEEQRAMINNAGFSQLDTLIKLHNFTTFVAQK